MTYTLAELDDAIEVFKQQLENIRDDEGTSVVIAPLLLDNFKIHYQDGKLILEVSGLESEPDSPEWMTTEFEGDLFTFRCDANRYQIEILYLIIHIWRETKTRADTDVTEILVEAFRFFKNRWTVEGEPKTDEHQRGFIGELIALMWVIQNKGEENIRYWDASGHAANDIEAPEFHVEAKAKTPTAQKVQISFQEQLQVPDNKDLYLAVTNVRLNNDSGLTLPEIRDNVLTGLEDSGVSTESLKTKIESWGLSSAIEEKFTSKFVVGKSTIYPILADDGCAEYADWTAPTGVEIVSGFNLILSELKSTDIVEQQVFPKGED